MSKIKRYKDYIKSLPCAVCQDDTRVDQHHGIQLKGVMKGAGRKNPEMFSFPLCREHHDLLHMNLKEWEMWYGPQAEHILKAQSQALAAGWRFDHE